MEIKKGGLLQGEIYKIGRDVPARRAAPPAPPPPPIVEEPVSDETSSES
jgi:hypothetical protein